MSESNLPQTPWHAVEDEVHSHGQDSVVVAMTAPLAEFNHGVRCEVARLIAAAPDLYSALRAIISEDGLGVYGSRRVIDAGLAALAKAEPRP